MQTKKELQNLGATVTEDFKPSFSRRKFLGYAGASTALFSTIVSSCKKYDPMECGEGIDLGSGDIGVLNYAYALEQLEAAFYTQVVLTPYDAKCMDMFYLKQIRDHEIVHREFFKNALGSSAIPALEVDFSSINFKSRESVLQTAKAFEDLGVSAYNGAGPLLVSPDYLTLAGKIVSVEARHAAFIRDLLENNSFAGPDVIDANGLDVSRPPHQVLMIAGKYIKTKLNSNHLPSF